MNLLFNMIWFEMRRFGYPLTNEDGAININNLLVTAMQPLFILIDLLTIPFLLAMVSIRTQMINNGKQNVIKTEAIKSLESIPRYLGNSLSFILIRYMGNIDNGIAYNMAIDPKRCFWYAYINYYYLVIDIEHAGKN